MHTKIFIFKTFLLCTLFVSLEASAQPKFVPVPPSCSDDLKKYCSDKDDQRGIAKCLVGHSKDLNLSCKQEIGRYVQIISEAEERGGGALTSFGGPNAMGPPVPFISYEGRLMPGADSPAISEHRMNLSVPIYGGDGYVVGTSLSVGELHIGDSILLNNGKLVPKDLHRYELGLQYFSRLPEKRMLTVRGSVGYSGDKPSAVSKDASYSFNISYGRPGSGNGYWMYMLFMTNNSSFISYIPIPGIVYMYKTPTFTGLFGFPVLSMSWTPVDRWVYSLSVFGPSLQSEVAYGDRTRFQTFANYVFNQQLYIPHDRTKDRDRLTIQDQKLTAGFRMRVLKLSQIEFQVGRSFSRSIYIGKGLFNKEGGVAYLEPDWFGSLGIKIGF